jgi:streptomycin 6-kinase
MNQLPADFIQNLYAAFGRAATEEWIARLPRLLAQAASRWDLELGASVDALSYNYVCFAKRFPSPVIGRGVRGEGRECILKIGIPNRELTSEIECLKAWGGVAFRPTVHLLESDSENGLLLLERLRPGAPLATIADDDRATEIAADLMLRFWIPSGRLKSPLRQQSRPLSAESTEVDFAEVAAISIADPDFITLKGWFDELKNLRPRFHGGTGPFPIKLVETVEGILPDLFREDEPLYLIHGDCHHYNILSHGNEWRVIDPKGVIGAREYEIAPFMLNPLYTPRPNLKRETTRRLDIFSERLGLDRQRLWAWTVAHSVLSAWWDLQEDGSGGEHTIASGEIFLEL